jgi:hypothetical protein
MLGMINFSNYVWGQGPVSPQVNICSGNITSMEWEIVDISDLSNGVYVIVFDKINLIPIKFVKLQ